MLERASGQFSIDGQVEDILGGISGAARIGRISQSCRFNGQLEGEGVAEFTAVLPREGDGSFHGFQRISGKLGEREGTFVLSVSGAFHKGQPRGSWTIVPKSGSGDFVHIRGTGNFSLPDGKPGRYSLEFDLRKPRAVKTATQIRTPEGRAVAQEVAEDRIEESPANIEESVRAVPTPNRKPRKKALETSAEAVAEPVIEIAPKRPRARKSGTDEVASVVDIESTAKRARSRKKVQDEGSNAAVVAVVPKPKRAREAALVVSEPDPLAVPVQPDMKPKRVRKATAPQPEVESVVAVADPEAVPTKPARRRKANSAEPIALPVAEAVPARRRRVKAA